MFSFLPLHILLKESRPGKPQSLKLKRHQTGWLPYTLLGHRAMHSTVVPDWRRTPGVSGCGPVSVPMGWHLESSCTLIMAEDDADPGEVQVSPMELFPVPLLAEVIAPAADAPAFSVPTAEATRIPAKPMWMYHNPHLPTGSDYSQEQPEKICQTAPTNTQGWGQFRFSMIWGRFQGW